MANEKKETKWIECRLRLDTESNHVVVQAKNESEDGLLRMLCVKMVMDAANGMMEEMAETGKVEGKAEAKEVEE